MTSKDDYIIRTTGKGSEKFSTGSQRDSQEGKPRYDLIPHEGMVRVANLYARGAVKYGDNNWKLGQPTSRYIASIMRHLYQYIEGDTIEDHLAAVVFGAMGIMHHEAAVQRGQLPIELLDSGASHQKAIRMSLKRAYVDRKLESLAHDVYETTWVTRKELGDVDYVLHLQPSTIALLINDALDDGQESVTADEVRQALPYNPLWETNEDDLWSANLAEGNRLRAELAMAILNDMLNK